MKRKFQFGDEPEGLDEQFPTKAAEQDPVVEQTLKDFRASVHAWSEAAYTRPRTAEMTVRQRSWRLAAGWALGCALLAGGVAGGFVEHHARQEQAQMAAREARLQQQAQTRQQLRQEDRKLLATVDSDISQEVPDAMEPLAQMMDMGSTQ